MNEKDLLRKLILTGHLNVQERKMLPDGKAKKDILTKIIIEKLEQEGQFPSNLSVNESFSGCLIIKNSDDNYSIYLKAEVSYNTYKTVFTNNVLTPLEAATSYIDLAYSAEIDGIPLN